MCVVKHVFYKDLIHLLKVIGLIKSYKTVVYILCLSELLSSLYDLNEVFIGLIQAKEHCINEHNFKWNESAINSTPYTL